MSVIKFPNSGGSRDQRTPVKLTPQAAAPSHFITAVAAIGMLVSGVFALRSLLTAAATIYMLSSGGPFESSPFGSEAESASFGVVWLTLFFKYAYVWVFGQTLYWLITLVCALGLYRRREWARKGFSALLVLGAFVIVALLCGWAFVMFGGTSPDFAMALGTFLFTRSVVVIAAVLAIAIPITCCWVAFRLNAQKVRAEFS
jgi:hypothetical protein